MRVGGQRAATTKTAGPDTARAAPACASKQPCRRARETQPAVGNQRALRTLQAKLQISGPGDRLEREADAVADRVTQPGTATTPVDVSAASPPAVQRACAACEKEDEEGRLQRKESGEAPLVAPPIVSDVLASAGRPLDPATHAFMGSRFGRDFGAIQIHDDAMAARSASAVGARAYTVGEHIVFGRGEYAPETDRGRHLLAHELTHALQQQRGLYRAVQRQTETAYDIQLTYPPDHTERHSALPLPEALRVLRFFANRVHAHIEGGREGLQMLHHIHDDQYIVAGISDLFGGRSIPPLSIWSTPAARVAAAQERIADNDVTGAAALLQEAATLARRAERQVYEYREGTIAGAERAVFGLQVVQVAAGAFITAATGGTAGVLIGAGYAGATRLATETTSVALGLQDRIDWAGVAFDTLFAAVAGAAGGRLGPAIALRLGGGISARVISSVIVGRASGLVYAAARELFDALRGRTELTVQGFIDRLAQQLTLQAVFLDLVAHAAGTAGESARGSSPPPPRPPLRSVGGGAPGRVRMEGGRVVSSSRSSGSRSSGPSRSGSGGGTRASAALAEPVTSPVEPVTAPVSPVAPVPEAPPTTAAAPTTAGSPSVSSAVAIAAIVQAPASARRRPECRPQQVPHLGGDPIHNACADSFPPNRYPGMDTLINDKHFDALQVGAPVLWEIKTDNFDSYNEFLRRVHLARQVPELIREMEIALGCGYQYRIGVRQASHRDAILATAPGLPVVVTGCPP